MRLLTPMKLTFFLSLVSSLWLAAPAAADDWKDVLNRDAVRVEARAVPGSKIKEFRATGRIEASPERVLAMLTDVESYPGTMPMTEVARLLRRDGASAWYYMVINAPVVSRRDYCIQMQVSRLPDGRLQTAWSEEVAMCPPQRKGLVRILTNHGHWRLASTEGGKATLAEYQGLSTPEGSLPSWITNLASAREMPALFVALRRSVASTRRPPKPVIAGVAETERRDHPEPVVLKGR